MKMRVKLSGYGVNGEDKVFNTIIKEDTLEKCKQEIADKVVDAFESYNIKLFKDWYDLNIIYCKNDDLGEITIEKVYLKLDNLKFILDDLFKKEQ